jgi:ABC-type branched-subunit amino acid transport system substrate-binding protein
MPALAAEGQPAPTDKKPPTTAVGSQPAPTDKKPPTTAVGNQPAAPVNNPPVQAVEETVVIGLISPELGPYGKEGMEQRRAAELAVEEINAAGGIMGKKINLVFRDSKSNPRIAKENAIELFDKENAQMIFGGVSSAVALVTGKVAKIKEKIFFGTSSFSPDLTAEEGHKYIFRECSDSWMAAKVLSGIFREDFINKYFFYVTVDDNWGSTTEELFRKYTDTSDKDKHRSFLTKLGADDFKSVFSLAEELETEVLVLILFGRDLEFAIKQAYDMGLKKKMQIVVPNITIDIADGAGPEAMEGILSTTPWYWKLPFEENYTQGVTFVKKYEERFHRYPSSAAASAYIIPYQYKEAVERAKTFDTLTVIKALEDHKYIGLKDEQQWRGFDHQSIQTVFAVKCKKTDEVKKDKYQSDYYEILNKMKGQEAAITKAEWDSIRETVGAPPALEE